MISDKQIQRIIKTRWERCKKEGRSGCSSSDCATGGCIHYYCVKALIERIEEAGRQFEVQEHAY